MISNARTQDLTYFFFDTRRGAHLLPGDSSLDHKIIFFLTLILKTLHKNEGSENTSNDR